MECWGSLVFFHFFFFSPTIDFRWEAVQKQIIIENETSCLWKSFITFKLIWDFFHMAEHSLPRVFSWSVLVVDLPWVTCKHKGTWGHQVSLILTYLHGPYSSLWWVTHPWLLHYHRSWCLCNFPPKALIYHALVTPFALTLVPVNSTCLFPSFLSFPTSLPLLQPLEPQTNIAEHGYLMLPGLQTCDITPTSPKHLILTTRCFGKYL